MKLLYHSHPHAPVAQLDRVHGYEPCGREFESLRARHFKLLIMTRSWKQALKNAITDPKELLKRLELPESLLESLNIGNQLFPLRIPESFLARIEKGNPKDPLLLQALPLGIEAKVIEGFTRDPLQEQTHNPIPGLLHKYHGRVLLITSGVCAINCRYCFRRSFPYSENNPGNQGWQSVLKYIENDFTISEVILSGGDPLTLTDTSLENLVRGLEAISHVTTLRIHSRIPVVLPERIDADFCTLFRNTRLEKILVVHVNHANELDEKVKIALQTLKETGFTLLNQSVLLREINDTAEAQIQLQRKLFAFGVLPYYLHLLDQVEGAAHFYVSQQEGQALIAAMMKELPGYLVPKLAREIPQELSKTIYSA